MILPKYKYTHPNLTATFINNLSLLADVHANQVYYVYSMQRMDPNYSGSIQQFWGSADYRVFEANCPDDLYVYDKDGERAAGIVNDEPLDLGDERLIASVDENGQKVVYLPAGEEYDVRVEAREDSEVSCGFKEYDSGSGKCTRAAAFRTVDMKAGETLE